MKTENENSPNEDVGEEVEQMWRIEGRKFGFNKDSYC